MKNIFITSILFCTCTLAFASENIHWGYEHDVSPEHWAQLSQSFEQCQNGKNQTPINITNTYTSAHKHQLDIEYKVSPHDIIFNGHTVQMNTQANDLSDYVVIDQQKYYLKQFHLHTPSENQIEGQSYPLELHFVNANAQGELAVIAVMFKLGKANPEWDKLWHDLSVETNQDKNITQHVDLEKLLPQALNYYRFSGSLTTPPCSEGVIWIVLKQALTLSKAQLNQFKNRLEHRHNNRPLQPANGRIVIED